MVETIKTKQWDKAIVITAILVSGILMSLSIFFPDRAVALQAFAGTILTIFVSIEVYFNHIQKLKKDNAELAILRSREAGKQLKEMIDSGIKKIDVIKKNNIEKELDLVPTEDEAIIILEDVICSENTTVSESDSIDEKVKSIFEKEE